MDSLRPRVELLEGRVLPATFTVVGAFNFGAGSLRQAIADANANPGLDIIAFNIPGSGVHTITPSSSLPHITDAVLIDGTSEPGYSGTPLIELDGTFAGFDGAALWLASNGSTIQGLAINRTTQTWGIRIDGANNTVRANYIGTDPTGAVARPNSIGILIYTGTGNTIGGPDTDDRNVISGNTYEGVKVADADGNTIQGNYVGIDVTGTQVLANSLGILIGTSVIDGYHNGTSSANNTIRGNVIAGNGHGVVIVNPGSSGNQVSGNRIGTNAAGTAGLGAPFVGVYFGNAPNNVVGGTSAADRNLLSGNSYGVIVDTTSTSIWVPGVASGNALVGNYIGTDVTGTLPLGNLYGVIIASSPGTVVGGTGAGVANVIAFNTDGGVVVDVGTGNAIRKNSIFANGGPGIELSNDGNNDQAAPKVTLAFVGGGNTKVSVSLQSTPNTALSVDVFSNAACDSSGIGEGQKYLGTIHLATDATGAGHASGTFGGAVPPGHVITATTTHPTNGTSMFSKCMALVAKAPLGPQIFRTSMSPPLPTHQPPSPRVTFIVAVGKVANLPITVPDVTDIDHGRPAQATVNSTRGKAVDQFTKIDAFNRLANEPMPLDFTSVTIE